MKFMQGKSQKINTNPITSSSKLGKNWLNQAFSTSILKKAVQLYQLNQQIKVYLPEPVSQHCYLMDWAINEIVLGVDAAEWLLRVRRHEADIKSLIISTINVPSSVKMKYLIRLNVMKTFVKKPVSTQPPSKISTSSRQILRSIAGTITDERLKTALLNLAND